jgi:glycosyltransferase involved in cell wall biosynthesis
MSLAVLTIIRALSEIADIDVQLLVGKYRGVAVHPAILNSPPSAVESLPVFQPLRGRLGFTVAYPRNFRRTLARLAVPADLVHLHGLWLYPTLLGCPILRNLRKPYVVSPHGSLMIDAMRRSHLKKSVVLALFERKNLESATALVATSLVELNQLRSLRLSAPATLVPLAVDPEAMEFFVRERPIGAFLARRKRTLLCVSRFHSRKHLVDLVKAFADVAQATPNWQLRIVGPDDERGYRDRVIAAVRESAAVDRISVESELEGERLWMAYRDADLFVLASTFENFGLVIGEALAAGLPVIATRGAPWPQLVSKRCGWLIDPARESLRSALLEAMSTPTAELWEMGRRGADLIATEFSPRALGNGLSALYRSLAP